MVETIVDKDQDGDWDVWSRDTDGDGIDDVFAYDEDGDGRRDRGVRARDTDGDGIVDIRFEDSDGDGAADITSPADPEGRPVAGGTVQFDRDGDGRFEERHEDVDGDGVIDHAYYDDDGDGFPETTVSDDDQDGAWDVASRDRDGDGLADDWAIDSDGNGSWDLWERDTDGDGGVDVWSYDLDGDGRRDPGIWDADLDGDGEPDVRYEDTDGDGFADEETLLDPPGAASDDEVPEGPSEGGVGDWQEVSCDQLAEHARASIGPVSLPGLSDVTQGPSCLAVELARSGYGEGDGVSLYASVSFDPAAHALAVEGLPDFDVIDGSVEVAGQLGVDREDTGGPARGVLFDRPDLHEIYANRFNIDDEAGQISIGPEPLPSLVTLECEAGVRLRIGGVLVVVQAYARDFMCTDYGATLLPHEGVDLAWSEQTAGEWDTHDYRLNGPHSGTICPPEVLARQVVTSQAAFEADFEAAVSLIDQIVDRIAMPAWVFDEDAFEARVSADSG